MTNGDVPFDSDERFERTRQIIAEHLDAAIQACVQPREFHVLIGPLVRLQEDAKAVTPGVRPDSWSAFFRLHPWRTFFERERVAVIALVVSTIGGLLLLLSTIKDFLNYLGGSSPKRTGSFEFITSAYAATSGTAVDPTVLYIFQIIILAMIPVLGIGGFYTLVFAKHADGRRAGKELLIGVAGFVLGAATRFFS